VGIASRETFRFFTIEIKNFQDLKVLTSVIWSF